MQVVANKHYVLQKEWKHRQVQGVGRELLSYFNLDHGARGKEGPCGAGEYRGRLSRPS